MPDHDPAFVGNFVGNFVDTSQFRRRSRQRKNSIATLTTYAAGRRCHFVVAALAALIAFTATSLRADDKPVSYYHDLVPILKRSCNGCHHPGKLKGKLDMTTYDALLKGGKTGSALKPGDPKSSLLLEQISGPEPAMPEEGDPLTLAEIALITRWIQEGATNDTPASAASFKLTEPPVYSVAPVLSALAYSPDGQYLAVSGYHEVLLHSANGSNLLARFIGESPRIESIAFSPDGKRLGVAGGAPARFGEIQVWDLASFAPTNFSPAKSIKAAPDSAFGLSFSPDGSRIAAGFADKSVRVFNIADAKEVIRFDNHSDWIFQTAFTRDGKRLLSASRDRAMKLIDLASGQLIDDINKLLDPILCMARHPTEDVALYGSDLGTARIYKISDNQGRTAANRDNNLQREFERYPQPIHAVAYAPDGNTIALAGAADEVRLYDPKDGKRKTTLKGHRGAIFSLAFHPKTNQIATAGFDGSVRLYQSDTNTLLHAFIPVPITAASPQAAVK